MRFYIIALLAILLMAATTDPRDVTITNEALTYLIVDKNYNVDMDSDEIRVSYSRRFDNMSSPSRPFEITITPAAYKKILTDDENYSIKQDGFELMIVLTNDQVAVE